jgi:hypothetical protein
VLALWGLSARGLVGSASAPLPRWTPLTFRAGTVSAARFATDGTTVVYSAAWGGQPYALFMVRLGSAESRALGVPHAKLLGVSSSGELAFLRGPHQVLTALYGLPGTLARVPLNGGGSREILENVTAADWIAAGADLAVVRGKQVEWPIGTRIYGSSMPLVHLRVAPGGDRLALFEGGDVIVLDRAGRKQTLASGLIQIGNLAWSSRGDEIWFSGIRSYWGPVLHAVSLSGVERVLLQGPPGPVIVQDVFRDGRALVTRHQRLHGIACLPPGESQLRELAWFDYSSPEALSADGRTVVFGDLVSESPSAQVAYLRRTDGSDAIRLGDGYPEDLSPDGKSVLVGIRNSKPLRWVILPTGPGEPKTLRPGRFRALREANFLPDGRSIAFGGVEDGHTQRIYVQDLNDGEPRAISPEGVATEALATPDARFVLGSSGSGTHTLYPVGDGTPRELAVLLPDDWPLQWSEDGRRLFVQRVNSWPPAIERVDIITGQRQSWKIVSPPDPAGVDLITDLLITPDGRSYCYEYVRWLSQLFIVEGLQ